MLCHVFKQNHQTKVTLHEYQFKDKKQNRLLPRPNKLIITKVNQAENLQIPHK